MIGQAFIRTMVPVIRRIKPFIRKSNEVIRTWMNFEDASSFLIRIGLKKMGVSFILEHCCEILEHIIRKFENPAAILDKKEPILEHPADILEDCYFIRI